MAPPLHGFSPKLSAIGAVANSGLVAHDPEPELSVIGAAAPPLHGFSPESPVLLAALNKPTALRVVNKGALGERQTHQLRFVVKNSELWEQGLPFTDDSMPFAAGN